MCYDMCEDVNKFLTIDFPDCFLINGVPPFQLAARLVGEECCGRDIIIVGVDHTADS